MRRITTGWLRAAFGLALLLAAVGSSAAAPPQLQLPVACEYGKTCFIQNYFDHDPGPGRADYHCGRLTYDGHHGTDFRLRDEVDMQHGVPVLAAAAGVVKATRDGMADISIRDLPPDSIKGREAGNGVIIEHEDGWTTQYSHMRRGSVAVHPGEMVQAGDRLGLVGLSGNTEFPHLDITVRHNGALVDPFVGKGAEQPCGTAGASLWAPGVTAALTYQSTGVLRAFLADAKPNAAAARRGAFRLGAVTHDPPALVLWVDLFGVVSGDVELFRLLGPDDRPVLEERKTRSDSRVSWFSYAGLRRPPQGWRPGIYRGEYQLIRSGRVVSESEVSIEISR